MTIFIKGLSEECIETLNILSFGDIYKKPFVEVDELCKTYSRSKAKVGKSIQDNLRDYVSRNYKPV